MEKIWYVESIRPLPNSDVNAAMCLTEISREEMLELKKKRENLENKIPQMLRRLASCLIMKKYEKISTDYLQSKERNRKFFWCSREMYEEGMILESLPPKPAYACCLTPKDISAVPLPQEAYSAMIGYFR